MRLSPPVLVSALVLGCALLLWGCSGQSEGDRLRSQVLERIEQGDLRATPTHGSITWIYAPGGLARVEYDAASGGEPAIPFPLVIDGERLLISGEMLDLAAPGDWITLTPELAQDLYKDAGMSAEERKTALFILAFVRYADPRRLISALEPSDGIQEQDGHRSVSGKAAGKGLLGDDIPKEIREELFEKLAFPRRLDVTLEVDGDGTPVSLRATGPPGAEADQAYTWERAPAAVVVPESSRDFRDWLEGR